MQWFLRLLLLSSFLKATALASQSKFYDVVLHTTRRVFRTHLYNTLHVAPFRPDESPRYLEVLFVLDLNVKPASILH